MAGEDNDPSQLDARELTFAEYKEKKSSGGTSATVSKKELRNGLSTVEVSPNGVGKW